MFCPLDTGGKEKTRRPPPRLKFALVYSGASRGTFECPYERRVRARSAGTAAGHGAGIADYYRSRAPGSRSFSARLSAELGRVPSRRPAVLPSCRLPHPSLAQNRDAHTGASMGTLLPLRKPRILPAAGSNVPFGNLFQIVFAPTEALPSKIVLDIIFNISFISDRAQ